ncbi:MAG: hypothetical protein COU27_01670 [Candidatus Levybacteria bacterium CG10_big_fil_rev_8_21_14_0_10_36_7]|nr:MAG: hypothetical protein COU27_01670 [Candidatus Levybacteria bacterium CG10_big_fil_rev_8_21_14_0_10_36_7]
MNMSLKSYMKEVELADKVFVGQLVFWLTIIYLRISGIGLRDYPVIRIFDINFYHFFIGVVVVFLAALFYKKFKLLSLVMFGIGVGFAANDSYSLFFSQGYLVDYWGYGNLLLIIFLGTVPLLRFRKNFFESPTFKFPDTIKTHTNPKDPKISVVIPAYNEEKFIQNTLKSLLYQTYRDFELIVVDNNSSDDTGLVAKSFGARVIVEKEKGVSHARNRGFLEAGGEIVASTDSDTVLPENWVETILKEYQKDNSLVAFGGLSILYSGPVSARSAGRFLFPYFWKLDSLLSGGWNMSGFNMSVRKSAFKKIGGFNTKLLMNEDVDLSKRLRKIGKIGINAHLLAYTSGRRYKNGLVLGALTYAPSWILRTIFKKEVFFKFPEVRDENSVLQKFRYSPLIFAVVVLAGIFFKTKNLQ